MSNRLARRADRLASLPPSMLPPERPGRRIHLHIEIVLHRASPVRRMGLIWWLILGLIVFAAVGRAEPPRDGWYPEPPPLGEPSSFWSSTTWSNSVTTYTNIYTGQGRVVTCTSYRDAARIVHTECGR